MPEPDAYNPAAPAARRVEPEPSLEHLSDRMGRLAGLVDAGQWLQRKRALEPELDRGAAHGESRCTRRAATVEQHDLRTDEAPELQSKRREQDRLSGPGRADDSHQCSVRNVQIQIPQHRLVFVRHREVAHKQSRKMGRFGDHFRAWTIVLTLCLIIPA